MTRRKLVLGVLVPLLLGATAAWSQTAAPATPSAPATACSPLAAWLQAPPSADPLTVPPPLAATISASGLCGCGDSACFHKAPLSACGEFQVCVDVGVCGGGAVGRNCACVTKDPP